MRVTLTKPSAMDCREISGASRSGTAILGQFQPRRYSKKQRLVNISLIEVYNEVNDELVDSGFLSIDTRTGKLTIERCTKDVPFDIEKPPETGKEKK